MVIRKSEATVRTPRGRQLARFGTSQIVTAKFLAFCYATFQQCLRADGHDSTTRMTRIYEQSVTALRTFIARRGNSII